MVLLCFREESKEKTSPIQNSKKTKLPLPRLACTSSKKFYACQTFDTGLKEANFRAPEHPIIPGKARTPPCSLPPAEMGRSQSIPTVPSSKITFRSCLRSIDFTVDSDLIAGHINSDPFICGFERLIYGSVHARFPKLHQEFTQLSILSFILSVEHVD